ncbi:hypothetical protein ACFVYJ_03775 [Pontibacter sp. JAM-7]|uniref:hypothetical protein n=1 Tax=Pontibacter sp. JAM-7 TaxID=3366581 RepID=UPI003AF789B8
MGRQSPSVIRSSQKDIDAFIEQLAKAPALVTGGSGRLLFALDATASRQPTWDHASHLQSDMFSTAAAIGDLQIQLCYFRGFGEFRHSRWFTDSTNLLQQMTQVQCAAGHTQIAKVLSHALNETRKQPIQAVVFVGDCMEERLDTLCNLAGQLGLLNTPLFLFQEGSDSAAANAMRQMARLSGGAHLQFDQRSADQLKALLTAVAIFATGGKKALEHFAQQQGATILRLTQQLK